MLRHEFLRLAREKYGNAFEYPDLPDSVKRCVISIVCKTHGKVEMIARDHLRTKHGCPRCAYLKMKIPVEDSNRKLIQKSKQKYKDKFDYSHVNLTTERGGKVQIVCPIHGRFESSLKNHLHSAAGCSNCGTDLWLLNVTKYKELNDAAIAARKIHGDKYTYLNYDIQTNILRYRCQTHGELEQPISTHLTGRGCMACSRIHRTITADEFIRRAKRIHPVGYSYVLSELKTVNDKITITHDCGRVYKSRVSNHLAGQGCMRCKSSAGEGKIRNFLETNAIPYQDQFKIDGYPYRFDFYLPELNMLIEYDGQQHFEPVDYFGGIRDFLRTRERDEKKNALAKSRGMPLIRVSYRHFDNLETVLSRAIGRRFLYRVNGVFYRNAVLLCDALKLSPETTLSSLEEYRTSNVLKPA